MGDYTLSDRNKRREQLIHEENHIPLFMHLSLKYHLRRLRSGKKPSKPFTRAKVFFLAADRCITSKPVLSSKGPRIQLKGAATEAGFDGKKKQSVDI